MEFTLKGDYFNGSFDRPEGVSSIDIENTCEKITKYSPANLDHKLWDAYINYENTSKVIASAQKGFETWRKKSVEERTELMKKFQEIAASKKDEIAKAIALETGKPLWESLTEAGAVTAKVNVTLADSLDRVKNKTITQVLPNIDGHIIKKPIGPSVVIGPFNFPCHLANGQILAALLTGNSIIFKPSEKTMYSAQLLVDCFHEAGFPEGVINLINGTVKTTQELIRDPSIKGIFFTGSLAVGKKILEAVGTDLTKMVALELGGKNVTILHKDTNIDHAVPELMRSCFLSSGQRCTSTSLIAVHKDIKDELIEKFKEAAKRIIIDHPIEFEQTPFMGPVIDEAAVDAYNKYLKLAEENGAKEILEAPVPKTKYKGHYVVPTIHYIEEALKSNPFTQEEVFGPNCCFVPYEDIEDAIRIANISDYGLAASVFTQDKSVYELCLRDIQSGLINLNRSTVGASSRLPFGGVKNSGNYRPAAVSMVDYTVSTVSSLETLDNSSKLEDLQGLKD